MCCYIIDVYLHCHSKDNGNIYDVCAVFDNFFVVTVYFYLIFDICLLIIITPRIFIRLSILGGKWLFVVFAYAA